MGSTFKLGLLHKNKNSAIQLLEEGIAEIERIELLLSEFLPSSETSKINACDFKSPLAIKKECFDLINRCIDISKLSKGAFDITTKPLKSLYKFQNQTCIFPTQDQIDKTLATVGYDKIKLSSEKYTLFSDAPIKISFAAIGKGYASDCVKQLWQSKQVQSGYINASGDLNAFGLNEKGEYWKVGIVQPDNPQKMLCWIKLPNLSIATSGDYEQFFTYKGVRYSHNINPFTGLPLTHIKSVSVLSMSAELSDALATAVYVFGVEKGIHFINQLPHTHCVIIDGNNVAHFSEKLNYQVVNN